MQKTKIEYLTHTWNPIKMRCTPISEGCHNCWHLKMADRLQYPKDMKPYLDEKELKKPLKLKQPARIGVQFMGDLFHESINADIITSIFDIMELAQLHKLHHTFFVLTKRPQRIEPVLFGKEGHWYLGGGDYMANIMLMTSIENQKTADERIPLLLNSGWVGKKGISFEPALEEVVLNQFIPCNGYLRPEKNLKFEWRYDNNPNRNLILNGNGVNWIIMGGESGSGARPMNPDWVRSVRDQCKAAKVPFFFKQWGGKTKGYLLDGKEYKQYPKF